MTATASPDARRRMFGYAGVTAAVLIWAGWIVATRDAMVRAYPPLDVALLRYGLPAVLLAPVWLRRGVFPRGERPFLLVVMTLGWGAGFGLLTATGLQTVPAAYFGPLVPGFLPMVVAAWAFFVARERLSAVRAAGLGCIAAAMALILGPALLGGSAGVLRGAPWLLAACLGWSAFTIAFRRTSLTGLEAAAYVCLYSTPFLAVAALIYGVTLGARSPGDILWQGFSQGVASGVFSVAGFAYGVRHLGIARASAFTSLVPALAALTGWAALHEAISPLGWAAIGCSCIGVLLVNRG